MQNPLFGNMNNDNNLDDMLNEMSKVLLNLKSDMDKVMTGINQLNFLILNIQQHRANNNMNNVMQNNNNIIANNIMKKNNMINMMYNMANMNNMNNNMMNQMPINIPKSFNINFYDYDFNTNNYNKITNVNVTENEKISEIIQKYRKIMILNKFVFIKI